MELVNFIMANKNGQELNSYFPGHDVGVRTVDGDERLGLNRYLTLPGDHPDGDLPALPLTIGRTCGWVAPR